MLIETVEELVEDHYRQVQPGRELLDQLRDVILDELQLQRATADQDRQIQKRRRTQLLDEQTKLLQAHYAEAIPLGLMKTEQQRIGHELKNVEKRLEATDLLYGRVEMNLTRTLSHAADWSSAYAEATPTIRRQMNQAIFKAIYIDDEGNVTSEYNEPFDLLLGPELTKAAHDHAKTANCSDAGATRHRLDAHVRREEALVGAGDQNNRTPTQQRGGLKYDTLVELAGRYSNPKEKVEKIITLQNAPFKPRRKRRSERRQPHPRLPEVTIDELVDAYTRGATINELADRFSINRNTVMKHLQQRGAESRRGKIDRHIDQAGTLYLSGWSLARVGQHFDVDPATVRNALKRHGIATRPRAGWRY